MAMPQYDYVIRNGTVTDGRGGEPYQADIAVKDGYIAQMGSVVDSGREEIDAKGLLVTPGFVDIHTHLDGHVTWMNHLTPSSQHGVTTAIFGNCGVGFAPCKPEDREGLMDLMEGVEDIPQPVLAEGLPWNWVSFGDYLDRLEERRFDIDIGAQLPHGPLRVFVMGQRALDLEPATAEDCEKMACIAAQAIREGAIGFATSRSINHRSSRGNHTPTLKATREELTAIARAVGETGQGVLQVISDFEEFDDEFDTLFSMARVSRRPLSFTLLQMPHAPDRWRSLLSKLDDAADEGLTVRGQVCGRAVGIVSGFELSFCLFSFCPTYQELEGLDYPEKLARLRDPAVRARIIEEFAVPLEERAKEIERAFASKTVDLRSTAKGLVNVNKLFPLGEIPDYEPTPDKSVAALAAVQGRCPAEVAYDLLLSDNGQGKLYGPGANFAEGNLDPAREMMLHPNTILGLSDAGAHCCLISDVSFSTHMLTHWARDRTRGIPLEQVVRMLTLDTASAVGLNDRGTLSVGKRADINIIDMSRLRIKAPKVVYDLPSGGKRMTQEAEGYVMSMVKGVLTYREGTATGALPGRLVRPSGTPSVH